MVRVVEVPVCNVSCMGVASWAVVGSSYYCMSTVAVVASRVLWLFPSGGVVVPYTVAVRVVWALVCVPVPCMCLCLDLC